MAAPKPRELISLIVGMAFGFLAGLLALQPLAQGSGVVARDDATTASLGQQPDAPAQPETHQLESENLTATVTVLRSSKPFPAGGSAFAKIELKNTDKSPAKVELHLEAETAVIRDVTGRSVDVSDGDGDRARSAKVASLAKGKPRTVIVELGLQQPASPAEGAETSNKLKITLRGPGVAFATKTIDWNVRNCAADYYSEIVKVREGSGSGIDAAFEAAQNRDKARPGRWLFPRRALSGRSRGKCLRTVKRWSSRRGRHVFICTKRETIKPEIAASPVEYERSVYRFASALVASRARDREFLPTRDTGWSTRRVSQNLRGFLHQEANPAICTGPLKMFEYLGDRMAGFEKRADKNADMANKSIALAELRTNEAIDLAKDDPGGHPGWGSAPLDLPRKDSEKSLQAMIGLLAQLTSDAALGQRVSDADNAFAALGAMSDYFKSGAADSLPEATAISIRRALSAIEAADYITTVAGHYAGLRRALIGSMTTLREAHARSCICGG